MSTASPNFTWKDMDVSSDELSLDLTLNMGQCFNWKKMECTDNSCWIGLLAAEPLVMKQTPLGTEYMSLLHSTGSPSRESDLDNITNQYFQLDHRLNDLYAEWGEGCSRMKEVTRCLPGARVVRQDPWECLISFICSSNNNIPRITQMLEKLRRRYGKYVCSVHAVSVADASLPLTDTFDLPIPCASTDATGPCKWVVSYSQPDSTSSHSNTNMHIVQSYELFAFPSVSALASASEEELRGLGMGYRAKFIVNSAKLVQSKCLELMQATEANGKQGSADVDDDVDRGAAWFECLRNFAAQARCATPATQPITPKEELNVTIKQEKYDDIMIKAELSTDTVSTAQCSQQREAARLHVQSLLLELPGVGRKVADCVALFSLDQTSAVPVDTHVWNIAIRDYAPQLRRAPVKNEGAHAESAEQVKTESNLLYSDAAATTSVKTKGSKRSRTGLGLPLSPASSNSAATPPATPKVPHTPTTPAGDVESIETRSLTPAVYEAVGGEFRRRFGQYAGWAHSVLFAAELGVFKDRLPETMQSQMKVFADLQRSAKKAKREEKAEAQKVSTAGIT